MYVSPNFKTKKALKFAVEEGKPVYVINTSIFPLDTTNGVFCVEGPHSPEPHRWYAGVTVENSKVIEVR